MPRQLETAQEFVIALSFARLELLEVESGKRRLTECPGVEKVAGFIRQAKLQQERERESRATNSD